MTKKNRKIILMKCSIGNLIILSRTCRVAGVTDINCPWRAPPSRHLDGSVKLRPLHAPPTLLLQPIGHRNHAHSLQEACQSVRGGVWDHHRRHALWLTQQSHHHLRTIMSLITQLKHLQHKRMVLDRTIKPLWVSTVMKTCSGLDGTPPSRREMDSAIVFLTYIDPHDSVYEPEERPDSQSHCEHDSISRQWHNFYCIFENK